MKSSAAKASPAAASPSPAKRKRSPNKKAATVVIPTAAAATASDPAAPTASAAALAASENPPASSPSSASGAAVKKKQKTTAAEKKKQQQQQQRNVTTSSAPPPTHVLVVDNGGETVKYGWSQSSKLKQMSGHGSVHHEQQQQELLQAPHVLENVTARLPQQWTVLVADQINNITNPNQLINVTRSMERGMICNMGNQVQVWKRLLDLLGVAIPLQPTAAATASSSAAAAAKAFGWKPLTLATAGVAGKRKNPSSSKSSQQQQQQQEPGVVTTIIPASACAVLLTVPPHCPRTLVDQIVLVWMEDFGFSHVGLVTGPLVVAQSLLTPLSSSSSLTVVGNGFDTDLQMSCIVDMGWSATHIVPTYRGRPIAAAAVASSETATRQPDEQQQQQQEWTIRRLPLGGRHLINLWKYYCTYRQYNLMDQDWILRDILIQTAFLSLDFEHDEMQQARQLPAGHRPYDVEYILPDYQTTFEGRVQLSPPLLYAQRKQEEQNAKQQQDNDDDDEDVDDDDDDDEDFVAEENMEEDDDDEDDGNGDKNGGKPTAANGKDKEEEDDDGDDEEEEDIDALRKRLLKQRQEEERRRLQEEQDQQVLPVSTERFTIPEVLFRPSDAGLPADWPGLAHAIVEAIQACPEYYRAALYRTIHVVGGLSQLTNLEKRLERELRALVPCEYEISITMASSSSSSSSCSATNQTWLGALKKAQNEPYTSWSVSRDEWEANRGAWKRLLVGQGGSLV